MTDEDFDVFVLGAKQDITTAQAELRDIRDQQRRKEEELKQKENQLAEDKRNARVQQLLGLNFGKVGDTFRKDYMAKGGNIGLLVSPDKLELPDNEWNGFYKSLLTSNEEFEKKVMADKEAVRIAQEEEAKREKARKELEEKAEAARVQALKPDKEKLIEFANHLESITPPVLKNKSAKMLVEGEEGIMASLKVLAETLKEQAEAL